jgi:UDP-N-acetylglucosamine/UDP-N-acetylgalactosamine diphosphorylase
VILKNGNTVFENPNGNGGCFITLKKQGILDELHKRGIEYIHVISVDNPLTQIFDPLFVGLNYKYNTEISAKFVSKRDPTEPVGIFLNINGKPSLIDYVTFPKKLAEERIENNKLKYRQSNILNYILSVKFLHNILNNSEKYSKLISQFNFAKKKIDSYDVEKAQENVKIDGVKFELFFHTIFAFCESEMLLLEVDRNDEFAPIKNADPAENDTPKTCRKIMTNLFLKWVKKAGGTIKYDSNDKEKDNLLEISFMKSYDGENLENEIKGKEIDFPFYLK